MVAPKEVLTFYAFNPSVTILSRAKLDEEIKRNPTVRTFEKTGLIMIESAHGFKAFAPSKEDGVGFIKMFIKKEYKGPVEPFITGGLQPVGTTSVPEKRYIFPLESEYKGLLTTANL